MRAGWFKFYRHTFDNPICTKDAEYFFTWCYLLTEAKFEEERILFKNEERTLAKGQLLTTTKYISNALKISESKVNRILKKFEIEKQIERRTSNKNTLITVLNWDCYQSSENQNEEQVKNKWKTNDNQMTNNWKTSEEQMTNERQTSGEPSYYNKELKNERNKEDEELEKERMEEYTPPISPSQREEVDEPKTKTKSKNKEPSEDNVHMLNRLSTDYCFSDFLLEKVQEWIEYKVARKETYVERGMKTLLTIILGNAQKYGDMAVADIIDLSMASNYKGILWDKIGRSNSQQSFGNGGIDWSKV